MEKNNLNSDLMLFFQDVTFNGINDGNKEQITTLLSSIVDNKCLSIFNNYLLYNFINLLKMQEKNTFLIDHLIKEVELKALRVTYLSLQSLDYNTDNQFEELNNTPLSQIIEENK